MEERKITREFLEFHKRCFENHMRTMTVLLEQTEKMLGLFLNENSNLSEEGRKAITEWIDRCREGRHEFSRNAQESYKKIEQTLF